MRYSVDFIDISGYILRYKVYKTVIKPKIYAVYTSITFKDENVNSIKNYENRIYVNNGTIWKLLNKRKTLKSKYLN